MQVENLIILSIKKTHFLQLTSAGTKKKKQVGSAFFSV